jgi:hypothetical protein
MAVPGLMPRPRKTNLAYYAAVLGSSILGIVAAPVGSTSTPPTVTTSTAFEL